MEERVVIKTIQEWGGSYDEIHDVIYRAHGHNRQKGIYYKSTLLDGEGIKKRVGEGITFVAIKDNKVVGTGSVSLCKGKYWYDKGLPVAHFCLDAVLPEYQGKGIMNRLDKQREQFAISSGAKLIRTGTAEKNVIQRNRYIKMGLIPVDFLVTKGNSYFSVMYVKWLDESVAQKKWKCLLHMWKSEVRIKISYTPKGEKTIFGKFLSKIGMKV